MNEIAQIILCFFGGVGILVVAIGIFHRLNK